jgi:hypothetical protein
MFKEFDPKELSKKRIEAKSSMDLLNNLFANHSEEFPFEVHKKNAELLKLSVDSFDFFFERGNLARAEVEINQALNAYGEIIK